MGTPLVCAVILLAGCAATETPAASVEESATPFPAAGCEPNNLVLSTGEPLDLTGSWDGGVFLHHVRQIGDCVWWIAYARWPGIEPGDLATLTFSGRLAEDFSLTGTWAAVVAPDQPDAYYPPSTPPGPVTFLIEFDPELGTLSELVLTGYDAGAVSLEFPIPYPAQVLRFVGQLPESANPPQQ
jgi:hypothetical protein